MTLIDSSYFRGEIQIPNTDSIYTLDLDQAIEMYERDYLLRVLGLELYTAMDNDLDGNGNPVSPRFISLVKGEAYQVDGKLFAWWGLRNNAKLSPIAYYVYCMYVMTRNSQLQGVGTTLLQAENAQRNNPFRNTNYAWQRMIDLTGEGADLCCGSVVSDCYCKTDENTLHHFLTVHKELYPEWSGFCMPTRNQFNL